MIGSGRTVSGQEKKVCVMKHRDVFVHDRYKCTCGFETTNEAEWKQHREEFNVLNPFRPNPNCRKCKGKGQSNPVLRTADPCPKCHN